MKYTGGTLAISMISAFTRPMLRLGVKAVDLMEAYYDALETPRHPALNEMTTAGGNSYSDLKLTIETFGGLGRVDITPGVLGVDLRNVSDTLGGATQAKEHLALCEATLAAAADEVRIAERLLRARVWLICEGGREAVDAFLAPKGDAAFNLSGTKFGEWKKQFGFSVNGVDLSSGSRTSLKMELSALAGHDLFVEYTHTAIGNPVVSQRVDQHFDTAENEMLELLKLSGLVSGIEDAQA